MTLDQPNGRRPRPTRHRGPIMLRGGEPDPTVAGTTTDQRLLDRRGPTDWVHTDPLRLVTVTPIVWPRQPSLHRGSITPRASSLALAAASS
jgi:hypothetical protein